MQNRTITLTANSGIVLELDGHSLWIDALHTVRVPGFSTVSPTLWQQIQVSLFPPELLFFTHCHQDHYSRHLAQEACIRWPKANLILPQQDFTNQILLSGQEVCLSSENFTLRFLRLPHEGNQSIPHYGLLLSDSNSHILFAGDCETASLILMKYLDGISVDLAVLNFSWLTLRRGRQYLENILRPRHLLLCHLPFSEDDTNHYLNAARLAAAATNLPDVRLLTQPLQREII